MKYDKEALCSKKSDLIISIVYKIFLIFALAIGGSLAFLTTEEHVILLLLLTFIIMIWIIDSIIEIKELVNATLID